MNLKLSTILAAAIVAFSLAPGVSAQAADEKADAVIAKAVEFMGGNRYLTVSSQVGRGSFSTLRKGGVTNYQTFVDVIVFPDRERTEFKGGGSRTVQVNTGDTGWVFDGDQGLIKDQTSIQVENFKRGIRTSLDTLLRGYWKGKAKVTYVTRKPGALGRRNDVIRLTYDDGFTVDFEFAHDGAPVKASFKRKTQYDDEIAEEDRYGQFVDIDGIKVPFIVDRFSDNEPVSRINYESVEFNKHIPDSAFAKPSSVKEAKKTVNY